MTTESNEKDTTTWRYCMTRDLVDGECVFEVREVYTGSDGRLSWTADPVYPNGSSWRDCANDIALMSRAVNGRVLDLTLVPPALIDPRDLRLPPGGPDA